MWYKKIKKSFQLEEAKQIIQQLSKTELLEDKLNIIQFAIDKSRWGSQCYTNGPFCIKTIVDSLYTNYSLQFQHIFNPVQFGQAPQCDCCRYVFQKHIQILPCKHIICEKCMNIYIQEMQANFCCPCCQCKIFDLQISMIVYKDMLNTLVYCPLNFMQTVEIVVFQGQVVDLDNFSRFLTISGFNLEVFATLELFNSNSISSDVLMHIRKPVLMEYQFLKPEYQFVISELQSKIQQLQLQQFTYVNKQFDVQGCSQQFKYGDLIKHFNSSCATKIIKCENAMCPISYCRNAAAEHQNFCLFNEYVCPVCFALINYASSLQHSVDCLNKLGALLKLPPDSQECQLQNFKIRLTQTEIKINHLIEEVMLLSHKQQNDIVEELRHIARDQKRKVFAKSAFTVFNFFYKNHIVAFTAILQCSCIIGFDYINQHIPNYYRTPATCFCIIDFVNLVFQYFHIMQFMYSNFYKRVAYQYFFTAYIVMVVNFACLYTFLQLSDPNQFTLIRQPQTVYTVLVDMLYFSSIISAKSGFGDVAPKSQIGRIFAFFNILMTIFILYIIFRGSSFYFRQMNLRQEIQHQKKQMNEMKDTFKVHK